MNSIFFSYNKTREFKCKCKPTCDPFDSDPPQQWHSHVVVHVQECYLSSLFPQDKHYLEMQSIMITCNLDTFSLFYRVNSTSVIC